MDYIPPESLLFLPEKLVGEMFTVPASAHTWGDIARANRDDGPIDETVVLDDILDATEIG